MEKFSSLSSPLKGEEVKLFSLLFKSLSRTRYGGEGNNIDIAHIPA
jgi:hypothetical protein